MTTITRAELEPLLAHRNAQAWLRTVRAGESHATDPEAYHALYGWRPGNARVFADLADHPRLALRSAWGWTSAAGAYQAMAAVPGKVKTDTWGDFVRATGPSDFTPRSQDVFALWCTARRGALQAVIEGRIADAIAACNREWASLPGAPYGQPTRTLAQALASYLQAGGIIANADGSTTTDPAAIAAQTPAPAAPGVQPKEKTPMGSLLLPLAGALIQAFTPLAQEKIGKEMARHTDNPEVAEQVAAGVIDAAKAVSGQADPIAAVAAIKADPQLAQQAEAGALDNLDRLAPALDKLAQWDAQAWAAEEASRDAAARRAAEDPHDQDVFLTRSIVTMVASMMLAIGVLIGVLAWLKVDATIISGLAALFTSLAGTVIGKFSTRYDHRYGSSRASTASAAVVRELGRRQGP